MTDAAPGSQAGIGVRDRGALTQALTRSSDRFADLLRTLPPGAESMGVPGLDWTVGETAAHVVTVLGRSLGDTRRGIDREDTARLNALCLSEYPERDPKRLADELTARTAAVVGKVLPRLPDDDLPVLFHGGRHIRLLSAYGVVLGDILLHGRDIASATGAPWAIPPEEAVLGLQGLLEVAPSWVDTSKLPASGRELVLPLPDPFPAYRVLLEPAGLTVLVGEGRPEGAAPVDPVDLLLGLSRRARPRDPRIAAFAGVVLPL